MTDWVIGIDLGGTKVAIGLINPNDEIIARRRFPTEVHEGPEVTLDRIAAAVTELRNEVPAGQCIAAVGICCPGPLDHVTGTLKDPPNLPTFHHLPLRQMLTERLDLPVSVEHDAKAAALGEFYYGAGKDVASMVYIVVGTGVGGAIIINGEIVRGEHNFAGEMGHMTIDPHGELCGCGSRGCVETYMSGPCLARRYARTLGEDVSTTVINGAQVAQRAAQGDAIAMEIMRQAGEALGVAVASMAMILDIGLYIIGGSVAKSGDMFLNPARETVPKYSFKSISAHVRIVAAALGDEGPLLGCGWLARQSRL